MIAREIPPHNTVFCTTPENYKPAYTTQKLTPPKEPKIKLIRRELRKMG